MSTTGIIHIHCEQLSGAAAKGTARISVNTSDQQVRDPVGNIVFSGPLTVTLSNGEATVTVPATDDATLSPTGFEYTVVEQLVHVAKSDYRVATFPVAGGTTVHTADVASSEEVDADPSYGGSLNGALALIADTVARQANGSVASGGHTHGTLSPTDIAIGTDALKVTTNGVHQTAIGYQTLENATTGSTYNTAIGYRSLRALTTGISNTAIGISALEHMTTGVSNTACGPGALEFLTTGTFNTALGSDACQFNTTGDNNVAIGVTTMEHSTTGGYNTAVGTLAMNQSGTASYCVAIGSAALKLGTGNSNIAIGAAAMTEPLGNVAFATTTGENAVAIGLEVGQGSATQRNKYVAIGYRATVQANQAVAIGDTAKANGNASVAVGATTVAAGAGSVSLGLEANTGDAYDMALGYAASATGGGSSAIGGKDWAGTPVTTSVRDQVAIGTATQTIRLLGRILSGASTTTRAGLNLAHGAAPTSPVNGDMWTTTAGLYVRINGATVGPLS